MAPVHFPLTYRSTIADFIDFLDANHCGLFIRRPPAYTSTVDRVTVPMWEVHAVRFNSEGMESARSIARRGLVTDAIHDAVLALPEKSE